MVFYLVLQNVTQYSTWYYKTIHSILLGITKTLHRITNYSQYFTWYYKTLHGILLGTTKLPLVFCSRLQNYAHNFT